MATLALPVHHLSLLEILEGQPHLLAKRHNGLQVFGSFSRCLRQLEEDINRSVEASLVSIHLALKTVQSLQYRLLEVVLDVCAPDSIPNVGDVGADL